VTSAYEVEGEQWLCSCGLTSSCASGRTVDGACEQRSYGGEAGNTVGQRRRQDQRWRRRSVAVDGVICSLWDGDT
jgi:hypothetical protein